MRAGTGMALTTEAARRLQPGTRLALTQAARRLVHPRRIAGARATGVLVRVARTRMLLVLRDGRTSPDYWPADWWEVA